MRLGRCWGSVENMLRDRSRFLAKEMVCTYVCMHRRVSTTIIFFFSKHFFVEGKAGSTLGQREAMSLQTTAPSLSEEACSKILMPIEAMEGSDMTLSMFKYCVWGWYLD